MIPTNYRTKEQYQKYVNEYMATLDAMIENDQNNAKQNELYQRTGQQIEELADTRSLDEKMLDVTRLVREVRALIATVTDPSNTNVIIEYLENNPRYLRFVIQNWSNIFDYMSKNYGVGVQSQIFLAYIKKLMGTRSEDLGGVSSEYVFNPNVVKMTSELLNQIIARKGELKTAKSKKDYDTVVKDLEERVRLFRELDREWNETFIMIGEDERYMDRQAEKAYQEYQRQQMDKAYQKYEQQQMGAEDINVNKLNEVKVNVENLITEWVNIVNDEMIPEIQTAKNPDNVIQKYINRVKKVKNVGIPIIKNLIQAVGLEGSKEKKRIRNQQYVEQGQMKSEDIGAPPSIPVGPVEDEFETFMSILREELSTTSNIDETVKQFNTKIQEARQDGVINMRETKRYTDALFAAAKQERARRKKSSGSGLVKNPSKPRLKVEGKVEKPASYVPIGRYIINRNDLGKGILKMRTAKGGIILKFPTEAISRELSNILKCVSQNGTPSIDDINALSTLDKNILHKIVKESHINLPVPDLKMDKNETEYRRFLLLKGEVLAGNNNPTAIKELKRIIIKLTAEGRLPRAQTNMVLHELAMLDL